MGFRAVSPAMNPERDEDLKKAIGRRLRACRKALGLTQEAAGEKFGLTKQGWGAWERGEVMLNIETAIAFCDEYHVPLDFLYRDLAEPDSLPVKIARQV